MKLLKYSAQLVLLIDLITVTVVRFLSIGKGEYGAIVHGLPMWYRVPWTHISLMSKGMKSKFSDRTLMFFYLNGQNRPEVLFL